MYRIKEEFADTIVGFAGSGKRLGLRSQEDLQVLAELCAVNKSLIRYFENYPGAEAVTANKYAKTLELTLPLLPERVDPPPPNNGSFGSIESRETLGKRRKRR